MKWFEELLNDKQLMKNIKTSAIGILALSLGIIYYGLFNSANFGSLLSINVAGLSVVALISVRIWRLDIRTRAFEDECDANEKIQDIDKEFQELTQQVINLEDCIDYVKHWNIKEQNNANSILTAKTIAKLERKRDILLLKHSNNENKYKALQTKYNDKIQALRITPLVDRKYKPITVKQMLSNYTVKKNEQEEIGKYRFEYNPILHGEKRSLLLSTFKFFGIGASGSLVFNDIAGKEILIYYGLLIISMILTVVINYPRVRLATKTEYVKKRNNKLALTKEMLSHKKKPILMIEYKEVENE